MAQHWQGLLLKLIKLLNHPFFCYFSLQMLMLVVKQLKEVEQKPLVLFYVALMMQVDYIVKQLEEVEQLKVVVTMVPRFNQGSLIMEELIMVVIKQFKSSQQFVVFVKDSWVRNIYFTWGKFLVLQSITCKFFSKNI